MGGEQLRCGMIGGGVGSFIGAVHRRAIAMDGEARVIAGALSSTPEVAMESAHAIGLAPDRAYAGWRELLERETARPEDERIDFVTIVTPNDTHHAIAKACLEAGFHVVCDKPLTHTSAQAAELRDLAQKNGLLCAVTYNYTGYPLVREMAELVRTGAVGTVRKVYTEYHQGWLATALEREGVKQAAWRTDPARAGIAGALGDIGTHAENLLRFVTGLEIESLCADLSTFVDGRALDDDASVLLRFHGGAKGTLTCSQVCVGEENGLSLRVYGEEGGLVWRQENPNELFHTPLGGAKRILTRAGDGTGERSQRATRIPPGHPEGYIEAFANVYRGVFERIVAMRSGAEPGALAREAPLAEDGRRGVRFVELCVESARGGAVWVEWSD